MFTELDYNTCTEQELLSEISRLEKQVIDRKNHEGVVKVLINSVYGAFGNPGFRFYDTNLAEAITLQGQHIIKFMQDRINHYFNNVWHKHHDLHEKLGIVVTAPFETAIDFVIYIDTDSLYIRFDKIIDETDWKGDRIDFVLNLYKHWLTDYITKCLDKYAEKWKGSVDNIMSFELEKISAFGLWTAKKKYALGVSWEDDDSRHDPLKNLYIKGIEVAMPSKSRFVRSKLAPFISKIFEDGNNLTLEEVICFMRGLKSEYKLANIEEVCQIKKVNNYEKYVLQDGEKLVMKPKAPYIPKSVGLYNHMVKSNPKWKRKYPLIKNKDQVYIYACKDPNYESFAFLPGHYPVEFAPEVDLDMMFKKDIIHICNRYIQALGLPPIPDTLIVTRSLF